ncbi:MAG: protein-L-isoaspartate O-methyltransferase [Deltaproteobacteria bacterium RIFCSPHIGHO2_12_FULL_43_9]|nr:MAG: protein-L-isoaspartate O-methyltransferase [Deltaproteobacteria bacterium RIFCSPHIGHO2_12_FULL_43_9]
MIEHQLKSRGIKDQRVLKAMSAVPREEFVPEDLRRFTYEDGPLPIGHGQTISQPYIVALMTELLGVKPTDKVLEIGTGSGYQAAVLAHLAAKVYTIDIIEDLSEDAEDVIEDELKIKNVFFKVGDGYQGWKEHAPFDKILLTAAPPSLPKPLIEQLKTGGKIVAPIGQYSQLLKVYEKEPSGELKEITSAAVRFVPMVGEAQKGD